MTYFPHTDRSRVEMLNRIGVKSIDELFADIPEDVQLKRPLNITEGMAEQDLVKVVKELANRNGTVEEYLSFLGAGAYEHYIPSFVDQLLLRSEFYTAYTPYQPEISQGTLQAIYEFQTMVCELTGMDAANASMYDGATATAEAAIMSCDAAKRDKIVVLNTVHPEYREVLHTYLKPRKIELVTVPYEKGLANMEVLEEAMQDAGGIIIQYPNFFGRLEEVKAIAEIAHNHKALLITVTNPMTLGLLEAPGLLGADIVCGEGQPFGNPLSYGGPYVGFLAAKEKFVRRMPGRIVGLTTDSKGRKGFVLTLQAREQHIRREKATSNICSNEALCALAFTMHLSALGKTGLRQLGVLNFQNAHYAAGELAKLPGVSLAFNGPFFHEFVITVPLEPAVINEQLLEKKIMGGLDLSKFYPELKRHMLFCVTETKSKQDIDRLVVEMGAILNV